MILVFLMVTCRQKKPPLIWPTFRIRLRISIINQSISSVACMCVQCARGGNVDIRIRDLHVVDGLHRHVTYFCFAKIPGWSSWLRLTEYSWVFGACLYWQTPIDLKLEAPHFLTTLFLFASSEVCKVVLSAFSNRRSSRCCNDHPLSHWYFFNIPSGVGSWHNNPSDRLIGLSTLYRRFYRQSMGNRPCKRGGYGVNRYAKSNLILSLPM